MAAEPSRSTSSADSYIGSLISLTSKSEIRYEGILYNINTDESSLGLRNVRSFGTEGRKKDGPQVPPSDKIYEYILFRGSDIKDLQVKSSPPVQTTSINNDPAIIQSHHYPRPASTSTSLPASVSGPLTDLSSHPTQVGHPGIGSTFQGGLPLYQPGGNIGNWGPSPPPTANGSGLPMPMYWQGFYGPPNGLPHLHQQSLLRPPPGLSMNPSVPQSMQYPGFNASLPTGVPNLPTPNLSDFPPSMLPAGTSSPNLSSTPLSSSALPSSLPFAPSATLASEVLPSLIPNNAPNSTHTASMPGASLPTMPALSSSTPDVSGIPAISNKPNSVPAHSLPYQAMSQPVPPIVGTSSSNLTETPAPSLVTPEQLLHPGPSAITSTQSSQAAHKDVEVVQVASSPAGQSLPVQKEARPPILPLPVPVPARAPQKFNGAPVQGRNNYRGRERGRGSGTSLPMTRFTEDFDFMAMNEKFKKDEVWGHLGKSNRTYSRDTEEDGVLSDDEFQEENYGELSKVDAKPVYNKDDFFDSLSSNALDRESQNVRPKFSEQMKLDTETFGDFSRFRGGRGGRFNRGGRSRGGYYGRGYGYMGRGRGRGMSGRAP